MKEVTIESQSDGRKWFCECNRWFDLKEDDGKIERELLAIEQPNTQKRIVYDDDEAVRRFETKTNKEVFFFIFFSLCLLQFTLFLFISLEIIRIAILRCFSPPCLYLIIPNNNANKKC